MPRPRRNTYQKMFEYIVFYKERNDGHSPTIREIQLTMGYKSTSVVAYGLDRLVEYGKIERKNGRIIVKGGKWTLSRE